MTTTDIPEGFEPHARKSPLTEPWEPLHAKKTEKAVIIGLRLARPHTNGRGLIHGGLIAALSDNAMGYSCAQATGWTSSFVTISLSPAGRSKSPGYGHLKLPHSIIAVSAAEQR